MFRISSICLLFTSFILTSCSQDNTTLIEDNEFIPVYARLLIINQLDISKEYHDKLVQELLQEYNIQVKDIHNTVEYYQKSPELWVKVLEKVKKQIIELQKDKNRGVKIPE